MESGEGTPSAHSTSAAVTAGGVTAVTDPFGPLNVCVPRSLQCCSLTRRASPMYTPRVCVRAEPNDMRSAPRRRVSCRRSDFSPTFGTSRST